jgi:hypothetical protein
MTDRLGPKQTAAMFTLMVLGGKVSNTQLRDLVGFPLEGKERTQVNDLHLVDSDRKGNQPFVHELTDLGWSWCRDELSAKVPPPAKPRNLLANGLYVLLGGLDTYLRREKLNLSDVFAAPIELTPEEIEHRIRAAYRKLARSPRAFVGLVDLRSMLGDAPTKDVDDVLKKLSREGRVHLTPEPNRKALTDAGRAAAVRIGGDDNHLIMIEASS